MIIDAHHHLWKFNTEDYGWMDESMSILRQDYQPNDLEQHLSEANVKGTVVVQARQKLEETTWLLELADKYSFIMGVVGWLDLQSDKLDEQLEKFTGNPKLVGVRHVIHDEPDDDFMLRPAFTKGIEKLAQYNLTYDLLLFPKHLTRAVELVSMFPDQNFVLDHISKPFIKAGILDPWREDLGSLAAQPNVWCKISGLVTEADMQKWKQKDFIPYLDTVVEAFGTGRIMLGSDWPVCRLAGEYGRVMEIGKSYFRNFDEEDKRKIFSENAISFYNLNYITK
ncbi:amidohydrolase family protein [Bacteroidota bacterium]